MTDGLAHNTKRRITFRATVAENLILIVLFVYSALTECQDLTARYRSIARYRQGNCRSVGGCWCDGLHNRFVYTLNWFVTVSKFVCHGIVREKYTQYFQTDD
jgi:hypothetical protein